MPACTAKRKLGLEAEAEGGVVLKGARFSYLLGEMIGEGTFSVVHKATQIGTGATVAVKRLKEQTQDPYRLRDELAALRKLGDSLHHIVVPLDATRKDGANPRLSIVMPYVRHDDFADALQRGAFTPEHIRAYMLGLFTALKRIHHHGFIHRDIKPSNVLYNFDSKTVRLSKPCRQLTRLPPLAYATAPTAFPPRRLLTCARAALLSQAVVVDFGLVQRGAPPAAADEPLGLVERGTPPAAADTAFPTRDVGTASASRDATLWGSSAAAAAVTRRVGKPPAGGGGREDSLRAKLRVLSIGEGAVDAVAAVGGGTGADWDRPPLSAPRAAAVPKPTAAMLQRQPLRSLANRSGARGGEIADVRTLVAAREGTRGFRAPEVLMTCPLQTPAIDVWSAGVIMLCLVTRRYPLFEAANDNAALLEIMALLGTAPCAESCARPGFGGVKSVHFTNLAAGRLPRAGTCLPKSLDRYAIRCEPNPLASSLATHPAVSCRGSSTYVRNECFYIFTPAPPGRPYSRIPLRPRHFEPRGSDCEKTPQVEETEPCPLCNPSLSLFLRRLINSATAGHLVLRNTLKFNATERLTAANALAEQYFQLEKARPVRRHTHRAPSIDSNASVEF